jgi:hypothetical protein
VFRFRTESGSEYEVDEDRRRIRRLSGNHEPTFNQGADHEWQSYLKTSPIREGEPVLIVWRWSPDGSRLLRTLTSRITEIRE